MAITSLKPIKVSVEAAINYIEKDKIESENSFQKKDEVSDALKYITRDKEEGVVIFHTITSTINCTPGRAAIEFEKIRNMHGKNFNNLAYHVWQSFEEKLSPEIAHEIGVKLAQELYGEYQCVISTHTNTEHTHNHIVFNSVQIGSGKKFHDCKQAKQDLRNESDRLCMEYGLGVLENTKECKWVKWIDENGVTRFYEPTDRKNRIIDDRKKSYDVNSYVQTEQYTKEEQKEKSNRDIIVSDIERFLPMVSNYEELLEQLKNCKYEIKDKTKSGDWRKHISFRVPSANKFTRDSMLDKDGAYTRETLELRIRDLVKEREKDCEKKNEFLTYEKHINVPVPVHGYTYETLKIENLDENYRYKKKDDYYEKVERSIIEKYIIYDIKKYNSEIENIISNAMNISYVRVQELAVKNRRKQYLIDRINGNLQTLKFVENREIKSFEQISKTVTSLYEKRNMIYEKLNGISEILKKANQSVVIIERYNELVSKIEENKNNKEYLVFEKDGDMKLLEKYRKILNQMKLLDFTSQKKYVEKVEEYNQSFQDLSERLTIINKEIKAYDNCIYNLNRVDRENSKKYEAEIRQYYQSRNENKIQESNKNRERE